MENGARYVVNTHWGCFSLDEGAYQDYLAGRLWISWMPGHKSTMPEVHESISCNVSKSALELRENASRDGVLHTFQTHFQTCQVTIPYKRRMDGISICEMNLSVRSSNALMRAGASTFGKLVHIMENETGLSGVRNLGAKSIKEIKIALLEESYARLTAFEKAEYWQKALDESENAIRKPIEPLNTD